MATQQQTGANHLPSQLTEITDFPGQNRFVLRNPFSSVFIRGQLF